MIFDVCHSTRFRYEQSVSVSQHVLHLMPRETANQDRMSFELLSTPEASSISISADYFGNWRHHLAFEEGHDDLVIESRSRVAVRNAQTVPSGEPWEEIIQLSQSWANAPEIAQFSFDSTYAPNLREARDYAEASFSPGRPIFDAALDLTARIFGDFEYQSGVSDVSTPVLEVLASRSGVCQDFAHLQISCLRSLGLPARYVSGYLLTHPPAGQAKLVGADASHAWISVWCGAAGWVDFDPTNNVVPGIEHITVGWGRDYGDVSPVNGFIVGGGAHEVSVSVDVSPVGASEAMLAGHASV